MSPISAYPRESRSKEALVPLRETRPLRTFDFGKRAIKVCKCDGKVTFTIPSCVENKCNSVRKGRGGGSQVTKIIQWGGGRK